MKRVLIIAYHYPPMNEIGALRPHKFAKYLPDFGWLPIICTVKSNSQTTDNVSEKLNNLRIYRTNYFDVNDFFRQFIIYKKDVFRQQFSYKWRYEKGKRKLLALGKKIYADITNFPDGMIGWYTYAIKDCRRIIMEEKPSLIFSTSPPVTAHLIACQLKKATGISWIADFRDLWTQNFVYKRTVPLFWLEQYLERRTLRNADLITVVSEPWQRTLQKLHKAKVHVLINGFDPADYVKRSPARTNKFTITYTGTFYPGVDNPESLFIALSNLLKNRAIPSSEIQVRFVGTGDFSLLGYTQKYGITENIIFIEKLPIAECIKEQINATVLLLFQRLDNKAAFGCIPGKFYEYLGAKRPILLVGEKKGVIIELLRESKAGVVGDDPASIEKILLAWFAKWKDNKGCLQYKPDEKVISGFTREEITRSLARLFDSITDSDQITN